MNTSLTWATCLSSILKNDLLPPPFATIPLSAFKVRFHSPFCLISTRLMSIAFPFHAPHLSPSYHSPLQSTILFGGREDAPRTCHHTPFALNSHSSREACTCAESANSMYFIVILFFHFLTRFKGRNTLKRRESRRGRSQGWSMMSTNEPPSEIPPYHSGKRRNICLVGVVEELDQRQNPGPFLIIRVYVLLTSSLLPFPPYIPRNWQLLVSPILSS